MGFFSRNKDEYDDEVVEQQQPIIQATASVTSAAPVPHSVDGVLPPGVTPQPAPPSHNLSSQADPLASGDMAGEYIVTDPPVAQATDNPTTDAGPSSDNTDSDSTSDDASAVQPGDDTPEQPIAPAQEGDSTPASEPPAGDTPDDTTPNDELPSDSVPELPNDNQDSNTPDEQQQNQADESHSDDNNHEEAKPDIEAPQNSDSSNPPDNEQQDGQSPSPTGDLADIKRQALSELSPLVSHLDQSPEEKFHTIMMLLQSTDDQTLIKTAYQAAQAITDEKSRAQALLDIVHEINYFSQQNN